MIPLTQEIVDFQQQPKWKRWAWPGVFALVMVMALAQLYVTFEAADLSAQSEQTADDTHDIALAIEAQQDNMRETLNNTQSTAQLIRDCTQPGGKCFAASQERTGEAVAGIGEHEFAVTIAGLTCYAAGETTLQEMAECTDKALPAVLALRAQMRKQAES